MPATPKAIIIAARRERTANAAATNIPTTSSVIGTMGLIRMSQAGVSGNGATIAVATEPPIAIARPMAQMDTGPVPDRSPRTPRLATRPPDGREQEAPGR